VRGGRKVALLCVDPWARHTSFAPFNYAVRRVQASLLGAGIDGAEVHLVETRSQDPDALLATLEEIDPDVVGASAYVWSFAMFVEVAERLKRRRPDVTVVFGGPSARPAMFELEPYRDRRGSCDALVLGEGEHVISQIVEMPVRDEASLSTIAGLALPSRDGFRRTAAPVPIADLDALPSAYEAGLVPSGVSGHIETFRGCPLSCSFCQWGDSGGNSRIFSREYLARELAAMRDLGLVDALIVDAGLNLNPRAFRNLAWAEREVGFLREAGLNFEIYPSHLTDEHLEFLSQVRIQTVGIGLQSSDKEVLRSLQRPFDEQRFDRVVRRLCEFPDADLRIEIILGLPHDGPESFMRTLARARELPCGVRVFHCLVLPDALMTRAPPGADMVFDPVTLYMRSCAGWTEKALRETGERLTDLCEKAGGQVEGGFYWSFPGPSSRDGVMSAKPMEPVSIAGQQLAAPMVARVSSFVQTATAGRWTVASVSRDHGVVVLEASTPEGPRHIELTAAEPGAKAYRTIGDVSVRYRPTAEPPSREFLSVLDGLVPRAGKLFSQLVHGAGTDDTPLN
jgi:hypothetical protein